jgi:hypothetical protein
MNELEPHQEWQRLFDLYHAMSDDDLLDLTAAPEELTEIARDVLRGELSSRRLEPRQPIVIAPMHKSFLHPLQNSWLRRKSSAVMGRSG